MKLQSVYHYREENKMKTWLIMLFFSAIFIALGWFLSYYYQSPDILYISIVFSVLSHIWAYWFSDKMVLRMAGARELTYSENPEIHRIVENLAITAGIAKPKIFIIQDPAPNAFATGRNEKHAVVALTTGLISLLDRNELEGVIAHELSHIRNYDMLISTIAVVFVSALSFIARMLIQTRGSDERRQGGLVAFIGFLVIVILLPILGTILRLALSRKREYLADSGAVMLTRYPEGLASALEKIASYEGKSLLQDKEAIAHLFIAHSRSSETRESRMRNFFKTLFSTHPPIEKRIAILRSMDLK